MQTDPYAHDPSRWGHSMAHLGDLMLPALESVAATAVAEVGAYAGDLTQVLVRWAGERGARVWAIDPAPQDRLVQLASAGLPLELVQASSLEALMQIPHPTRS